MKREKLRLDLDKGLGVVIRLGIGDPCQIVSGTSAKADRAVMLRTEPTCFALPVEIAPKLSIGFE